MQPAPTIHPRVGSVFSVPNVPTEQEELNQSVEVSSTASPDSDTYASEKPSQLNPHPALFVPEEAESDPRLKVSQPSQPTTTPQNQPMSSAFQPLLVPGSAEQNSSATPSAPPFRSVESKSSSPSTVIPVRATPMAAPHPPFHHPTIAQSQRQPDSRPRVHDEPEEIQIHIGRIEVSAISPTPNPTAVKAPRKSSSLDDYLRRRDRRTL
jgi:hypothetical protein